MLKNYFKTALRNLVRYKIYSFINIFGLAISIACCILFFLFIENELSYDSFHKNADRIFRVNSVFKKENSPHIQAVIPAPMGPALKEEFPEIELAVRILKSKYIVKYQDKIFSEKITYIDPDFFKMFSFKFVKGNTNNILKDKNAIVLREDIAKKYFGDDDPIGKLISIQREGQFHDFIVTGIAENIPENSSIQFDFLLSFEKLRDFAGESYFTNWGLFSVRTFVQLNASSQVEEINTKFPTLIKKYVSDSRAKYYLQPLNDIHFGATVQATMVPTSSKTYSYVLAGIAFLILSIACINFMNISIAHAVTRYKEIGMRKVMGAIRSQLILQFLGEALLLSAIAFALGIGLTELFLPTFNKLADKTLTIDFLGNWYSLGGIVIFILLIGFMSGAYPALFLSKYQPVEAFKGKLQIGRKNLFSKSLVITQFGLSIFLIICTGIMGRQLNYLRTQNWGFNSDQIVIIPFNDGGKQQTLNNYRNELKHFGSIINVAGANAYPGGGFNGAVAKTDDASYSVNISRIDYDYVETLGIKMKKGRTFSRNFTTDISNTVLINEALANQIGRDSAIGKKLEIKWVGGEVEIIGVVKNFHYTSFHEEILPLVFYIDPDVSIEYIFVKINTEDIPGTIALLKNKWQQIAPGYPFDYFFLDQKFDQLYRSDERWSKIVKSSSILAILIACFGLFGLSALVMAKRTKEIGVRKVLGASVYSIVQLLSKEFTKWVLVANFIAWPGAYFAMNKWLQDFAYRIDIDFWAFVLAGGVALVIALLTVSILAVKAALANPVESLRYE